MFHKNRLPMPGGRSSIQSCGRTYKHLGVGPSTAQVGMLKLRDKGNKLELVRLPYRFKFQDTLAIHVPNG
jgi:hypothetical protein